MKTTQGNLSLSVLTLAVRSALAVMAVMPLAVMADDAADAAASAAAVAAQAAPTNTIEVGGIYTTKDSAKFGEYNGLNKKGFNDNGNLSLKGGDAYGMGTGTRTWSLTGTDLSTTSREIGATMSDQGKWKFGIDYDELQHNIDDSYKTPYQGAMGGNTFTLPSNFGVISSMKPAAGTVYTSDGVPYIAKGVSYYGAMTLTPAQQQAFQQRDVHSNRDTTSLSAAYNVNTQLNFTFDFKHIDQSGAKLMAASSDKWGPTNAAGTTLGSTVWGAEKIVILMNPTSSKTDNFNLALNWKGDKGFFSAGYYGSLYHDDYSGVNWSNPYSQSTTALNGSASPLTSGFPLDSMSLPPSNQFHQLNLTGGYHVSTATKLVGGVSYARNTQNMSFDGTYTPGTYTPGQTSLDASVILKHADAKLTNRTTDALDLSAGFTYNERDNHTSSHLYSFYDLGAALRSPVSIPESWKRMQFDIGADFKIDSKQRVHAGYDYDEFKRWCDADSSLYAIGATGVTGSVAPFDGSAYGTATSCAQVPKQTTNGLDLDYKITVSDALRFKAGYGYSDRSSEVNSSFYSPLHSVKAGYEDLGYLAFFQASRKENALKLSGDWQANDKLDITLSGKYAKDDYSATFGVQKGTEGSINLDATYTVSENETVNAYITQQHRTRDLKDANTPSDSPTPGSLATAWWTNNMKDDQLMFGLGSKQKSLMGGKLSLSEDLTYSLGKTDYAVAVGGTGTGSTCVNSAAPVIGTTTTNCGSFPTVKSDILTFKLTGNYQVSKPAKVVMAYQYQHMKVEDPYYYGDYQYGYVSGSGTLPTYQQAPNYNVSVFYLGYAYSFQ